MGKNVSSKYGEKRFDNAKKSTSDAIKTASKAAIKKKAEATGDLIGITIADKLKRFSKKSSKELQNKETKVDVDWVTLNKRCISPEER